MNRSLPRVCRDAVFQTVIARVPARASRAGLKPCQPLCLIAGGGRAHALCGIFREPYDLQRPRALLEPADIASLLKRRDQAMDARLRAQVQHVLHLIERWRHARLADALMDEHQELILLLGQHGIPHLRSKKTRANKAATTANRSTLVLVS